MRGPIRSSLPPARTPFRTFSDDEKIPARPILHHPISIRPSIAAIIPTSPATPAMPGQLTTTFSPWGWRKEDGRASTSIPPGILTSTPILQELGLDPIRHYFMFGGREKKSPSPLFDAVFYAKTYAIEDCADLFGHYLRHGQKHDRQPCSWFDPRFYRQTYLAEQRDPLAPLQHFLETGLANRHCTPTGRSSSFPKNRSFP